MPQRTFHPVHKSLNTPLTIMGAERSFFFLALMMGGATFNLFGTVTGGLAMFIVLLLAGRIATRTDPQILRILLNSTKFATLYDPGKRSDGSQGAQR